jgi:Hom_end-associated Hint/UvrD-like helicase C-terminal domain/AAA domain
MVTGVRKLKIQPSVYQQAILGHFDFLGSLQDISVNALAGSGKCLGKGTPILMFDGTIQPVEDVQTGDLLMGDDSTPRNVLTTCRGVDTIYRITPVKGDAWVCNSAHILTMVWSYFPLVNSPWSAPVGVPFDIPLQDYLGLSACVRSRLKQIRTGVNFLAGDALPYDPYFMGLWLGDGLTGLSAVQICDQNQSVLNYIRSYGEFLGYRVIEWGGKGDCTTLRLSCKGEDREPIFGGGYRNKGAFPLLDYLRDHFVKDEEKRIPLHYLTASREDRLKLLGGLLDIDGYFGNGCFEITTKFSGLKDDLLYLARSLGFSAYATYTYCQIKSIGFGGYYWRLSISGNVNLIPSLYRDVPVRKQIKSVLRTGISVKSLGTGDYFGFEIDGNGRFLLGDFTVTHNTSLLKMIAKKLDQQQRGSMIYLAFNREIVKEVESVFAPMGVKVQTFHGWGMSALMKTFGKVTVDDKGKKYKQIWEDLTLDISGDFAKGLKLYFPTFRTLKVCGLLRTNCFGLGEVNDFSLFLDVLRHPSIDLTDLDPAWLDVYGTELFALFHRLIVAGTESFNYIDFTDMLYLPAYHSLRMPHYDFYLADEAQDFNLLMQYLLKQTSSLSHKTFVMDRNQAIYGFAGSDEESCDRIHQDFDTKEYPLSVCYRCPDVVLDLARKYVPEIEGTGKVGEVLTFSRTKAIAQLLPGDLFISRTNAPLVKTYFQLVAKGMPASIKGRNYLQFMHSFISTMEQSLGLDLLEQAQDAYDRKVSRLEPDDPKRGLYGDVHECIDIILESKPDIKTCEDLKLHCDFIFSVDGCNRGITLASIHRSKGLENPRVFLYKGSKGLATPGNGQKSNLSYVGITRAQNTLVLVDAD